MTSSTAALMPRRYTYSSTTNVKQDHHQQLDYSDHVTDSLSSYRAKVNAPENLALKAVAKNRQARQQQQPTTTTTTATTSTAETKEAMRKERAMAKKEALKLLQESQQQKSSTTTTTTNVQNTAAAASPEEEKIKGALVHLMANDALCATVEKGHTKALKRKKKRGSDVIIKEVPTTEILLSSSSNHSDTKKIGSRSIKDAYNKALDMTPSSDHLRSKNTTSMSDTRRSPTRSSRSAPTNNHPDNDEVKASSVRSRRSDGSLSQPGSNHSNARSSCRSPIMSLSQRGSSHSNKGNPKRTSVQHGNKRLSHSHSLKHMDYKPDHHQDKNKCYSTATTSKEKVRISRKDIMKPPLVIHAASEGSTTSSRRARSKSKSSRGSMRSSSHSQRNNNNKSNKEVSKIAGATTKDEVLQRIVGNIPSTISTFHNNSTLIGASPDNNNNFSNKPLPTLNLSKIVKESSSKIDINNNDHSESTASESLTNSPQSLVSRVKQQRGTGTTTATWTQNIALEVDIDMDDVDNVDDEASLPCSDLSLSSHHHGGRHSQAQQQQQPRSSNSSAGSRNRRHHHYGINPETGRRGPKSAAAAAPPANASQTTKKALTQLMQDDSFKDLSPFQKLLIMAECLPEFSATNPQSMMTRVVSPCNKKTAAVTPFQKLLALADSLPNMDYQYQDDDVDEENVPETTITPTPLKTTTKSAMISQSDPGYGTSSRRSSRSPRRGPRGNSRHSRHRHRKMPSNTILPPLMSMKD